MFNKQSKNPVCLRAFCKLAPDLAQLLHEGYNTKVLQICKITTKKFLASLKILVEGHLMRSDDELEISAFEESSSIVRTPDMSSSSRVRLAPRQLSRICPKCIHQGVHRLVAFDAPGIDRSLSVQSLPFLAPTWQPM